jgi:hypothetical protein
MPDTITQQQIADLLPIISKEDQQEVGIAWENIARTLQGMREATTAGAIANHRAAHEFLRETYTNLIAKYQPDDAAPAIPGDDIWKTFTPSKIRLDVYRFLAANGWDLSQRTFFRHVESGKLKKNKEGLYSARAVKKYAETWAVRTSGKTIIEEEEDLAAAKTRAEIKRIATIQEREAFRLEIDRGKYLKRDDVELQLAARAVALEAGFDHMAYTKASEFIALVGGKQEQAELLIAALLVAKDEWLKSYASADEFEVVFEG